MGEEEPIIPVQNVIAVKDQLAFKVLLANWRSPSSEVGSYKIPRQKGEVKEDCII